MANTAAKRRTMRVTETEIDAEDEADQLKAWDEAPLFAAIDRQDKHIDAVSVRRTDPPSGYLGTMPPDVSEASLAAKWGGGSYILEGKNADTRIVPNARRTIKIAGDPVFAGEVEEIQYRRSNGLPVRVATATPAADALSTKDLLMLLEEKEERRRAEQLAREDRARTEQNERDDRERRLRDERALQLQKDADDRKAREVKDQEEREERRARATREDDERRARIHREDMERMQAQNTALLAQSQQFFQQQLASMAAAVKEAPAAAAGDGGAVKALLTGLQVARDFMGPKGGSGGEGGDPAPAPDLLTSLIQRLPETLAEVRKTAGGVYSELTGKGGQAGAPAGVPPGQDFLTIVGPTASKAKAVIAALAKAGKNPEAELSRMLSFAAGALAQPKAAPPAVVASSPPSPARRERLHQKKGPPQRQQRRGRATVDGGSARPALRATKVAPVRRPAPRPVRAAARRRRKGAAA